MKENNTQTTQERKALMQTIRESVNALQLENKDEQAIIMLAMINENEDDDDSRELYHVVNGDGKGLHTALIEAMNEDRKLRAVIAHALAVSVQEDVRNDL